MHYAVYGDPFSRIETGIIGVYPTRWEADQAVAAYLCAHEGWGYGAWVREER